MNKFLLAILASGLLCASQADARDMRDMARQIKAPITIEATEMKNMAVTFNHSSHKSVDCITCHHAKAEDSKDRYVACTTCHNKPGAKQRHYMSTFMAFHSKDAKGSCYGCHQKMRKEKPEKYAVSFRGCAPCHNDALAAKGQKK